MFIQSHADLFFVCSIAWSLWNALLEVSKEIKCVIFNGVFAS